MTRFIPRAVPTAAAALTAVLVTACASTESGVKETGRTEATVPDGELGVLVEDLMYGSPEERGRAAGDIAALRERGAPAAPFLVQALQNDQPPVRVEAARALSLVGADPDEVISALVGALGDDEDADVQVACSDSLGRLGEPAVGALVEALETGTAEVRALAARSLAIMGESGRSARQPLVWSLRDESPEVRAESARALGRVSSGSPEAVQPLVQSLDDEDERVRSAAAWSLGEFGETARWTTLSLVNRLEDSSVEVRREAARALGKMGPSAAQASMDLKSTIELDPSEAVRREAAEALRRIRNDPDPAAEPAEGH